jgi:hypothetical protein
MGRDLCCLSVPDLRGDLGAVLYETQKVVTVEVMRRPPTCFHPQNKRPVGLVT